MTDTRREPTGTEIAIVGMAGRFPGARDLAELWQNLRQGVEAVRFPGDAELLARGLDPARLADPAWVKAVSQMDGYDSFDDRFFGINPREAELMDPQHRVFLECAWEALESAGYDPEGLAVRTGVYAGATISTYLLFHLIGNPQLAAADPLQVIIGNAADSLTTRVSYKLNLKGPSHSLNSACSTSLVAVHTACQALLNEECDLALGGGGSGPGDDRLRRGARSRHGAGRSDRDPGGDQSLPRVHRPQGLLRHRLGEEQLRASRRGGRSDRADQDRARPGEPRDPAQSPLREPEPAARPRVRPGLRQPRAHSLARRERAAPGRRQLLR